MSADGVPSCFLHVFRWGRWSDILAHGRFKRPLKEADVETICRALLAYCLLHYRGDENIKSFIWDLITPSADGTTKTLTNHSGLSTPVPRGRKGKKGKPLAPPPQTPRADWLASCNPDHLLQEDSYKRHLKHHCNKVLLRVRMLYYLRQEVIGDQADRILEGADSSELDVWIPQPFHAEVPADWWDSEADKSLLIGVFKHETRSGGFQHGKHHARSHAHITFKLGEGTHAYTPTHPTHFCCHRLIGVAMAIAVRSWQAQCAIGSVIDGWFHQEPPRERER
ncbi:chromodomain-helicase-DNA-binding protein 7-like, partial [Anarrhichthys ocellatus]|uniref:chromodomain-helicase-DNA-binding protein 7-like n=1 Tax=Anarrhichthys ocellatus TaxID=433405 RepID=UPI0012EE3FC3